MNVIFTQNTKSAAITEPVKRWLVLPMDAGDVIIPFGISEEDYQLLIDSLELFKPKIVEKKTESLIDPNPEVGAEGKSL